MRSFLELLFEPVRHLLQGVERGRAWPGDLDDHGLHGEVGVLLPAEPLVGAEAADGAEQHEEDDDRLVVDRPFGKIEARHHLPSIAAFTGWLSASEIPELPSVSGFTGWPSASELTPAVTTFSPADRPRLTTTESALNSRSSTARRCTVPSSATTQTCGPSPDCSRAFEGTLITSRAFGFGTPDNDGAEAHLRRWRGQRHLHLVSSSGAVGLGRDLTDGADDRDLRPALQPHLDGHAECCMSDMFAGHGKDRLALRTAGDLDHLLACGNDLAGVGGCRRHDAVVGRKELGVAQLVLRNAKIGFG